MRPIVLIPGIGGSVLVDRTQTHKQFLHWRLLDNRWLNLYPYHPSIVKRWKKDMGYDVAKDPFNGKIIGFKNYNPNIGVYNFGGTLGVKDVVSEFLLLSQEHQDTLESQYHFRYFHALCEYFYDRDYDDNLSLIGMPYDFRLVLDPQIRTKVFQEFKDTLEQTVNENGKASVVVTHSFGGLLLKWFMGWKYIDHDWLKRHIYRWVCISCPFGGAPLSLRAATSGDYYLPMFHKVFKDELNKNSAMIACLPNELAYNANQPLIVLNNGRKISIRDYGELASRDHLVAFQIWRELLAPHLDLLQEHVPVMTHIVRNDQVDTPDRYYVKSLNDYPYQMDFTAGDGVVTNASLLAYNKVLTQSMTRDMIVPFANHTSLISDKRVLHLIEHYAKQI